MAYGKPLGRIPVGPKADKPIADQATPEAPVTNYLVGQFEYYDPRYVRSEVSALTVRKSGVALTAGLARELEAGLGKLPERITIGIDRKRCLIEVKPDTYGLSLNTKRGRNQFSLVSPKLAQWLRALGVPAIVEAHWQAQTQSVVGRYVPAPAADAKPESKEAVNS